MPTVALLSPRAQLVLAQRGRQVTLWRRADGRRLASWQSRSPLRGALAAAAVVGVFDNVLQVRQGPGFRKHVRLRLPPKVLTVYRSTISADGRLVAAYYAADGGAGDPTAVTFYDARNGRRRGTVRLASGRLQGVVLSDDGRYAVLFGDRERREARVEVYALDPARRGRTVKRRAAKLRTVKRRAAKPRLLWRWKDGGAASTFGAAFSPDGKRLVVAAGRRIVAWDLRRGRVLATRPTQALLALFPPALRRLRFPSAHQLLVSADGREVLSMHALGVTGVGRWSPTLEPRGWLARPSTPSLPRQLAAASGGQLYLVAAGRGAGVELYRSDGRRFVRTRLLEL